MTDQERANHFPWFQLTAVSVVIVSGIDCMSRWGAADLSAYFGQVPPLIGGVLVCATGTAALYLLHRIPGFYAYAPGAFKIGAPAAAALAVPFMIAITAIDVLLRFPRDINVPLPIALAFYPVMGFVAQMALHVVPFALLMVCSRQMFPAWTPARQFWMAALLAALPEALFQIAFSARDGEPGILAALVAAHLYLFGLAELYLYRRFDYASMFVFRMVYYGYWHVAWGTLRMSWLFQAVDQTGDQLRVP